MLGETVRDVLLEDSNPALSGRAELFLFLASRAQLTFEVIRPALAAGRIVLADRFYASTAVYQGHVGGILPIDRILALSLDATAGLIPDVTFVLELSPETARARARERGVYDRFDERGEGDYARVVDGYRRYAQIAPETVVAVDAGLSEDEVFAALWARVEPALAQLPRPNDPTVIQS